MINISIKGAVDTKRLERAFQEALNRYVDYYGDNFDAFYDVELLLKAKNTEGIDVFLPDSLCYTNECVSPVLTDEPCFYIEFPAPFDVDLTVGNESYSDDDYEYDHEHRTKFHEEYVKQQHERQIEQQKQRDEMMLLQSELDKKFAFILNHLGNGVIDEFNEAITEIWAEQKPIANNGKHKGQTSFMPFFKIDSKYTRPLRLVTSSSNLRGKGVLNPLYEATWQKKLVPIHDTVIWRTHVLSQLEKIMDDYYVAASNL